MKGYAVGVTERGVALAKALDAGKDGGLAVYPVCSKIARHAQTLHAYYETACNRELRDYEGRKVVSLEKRVAQLVNELSTLTGRSLVLNLNQDPRGYAVKIADGTHSNTWGGVEDGVGC